ncbi:hypothetical protein BDD12DRAFT_866893 [Trichophaea hybrida]|nr:hypothetical protein BDD12DRAFT_866893 [Trichophaea hybrida]
MGSEVTLSELQSIIDRLSRVGCMLGRLHVSSRAHVSSSDQTFYAIRGGKERLAKIRRQPSLSFFKLFQITWTIQISTCYCCCSFFISLSQVIWRPGDVGSVIVRDENFRTKDR